MPEQAPKAVGSAAPAVILALRAREAAKALGISPRLLATLTAQRRVPFARINTVVVYPVPELQRWLSDQARRCHDSATPCSSKAQNGGVA